MSTLPPHDVPAIFWIDGAGQQQGPESLATVIERIAHDQIPSSTPVWWQGAVNWLPFNSDSGLAAALDARLNPAPAPAPTLETPSVFAAPGASAFSTPAPSESATPFSSPTAFDAPTSFEAPVTYDAPSSFEAPAAQPAAASYDAPVAFQAPVAFEAPAEPAAVTYDAPAAFESVPVETPAEVAAPYEMAAQYDGAAQYEAPVVVDTHFDAPVVTDVPEVIVPDEPAVVAPTLDLGDTSQLESTFASLTERSAAFDADVARAAGLDQTLATTVRQALTDLGFVIEDTQVSDDYHSFRLSEPDGAAASLAIQRIAPAISVAAAVERPIACFVDRAGRASVGMFVGDYLDGDGFDQAKFNHDLASVVHTAGTAN